jgi:phage recombination protein Bet
LYICAYYFTTKQNTMNQLVSIEKGQIETLVQAGVIPKETPPAQIKIFSNVCENLQLNPFTKEIYLVGYKGKYSVITSINGFRKIASRTGEYAGSEDPKYNLKSDGSFKTAAELIEEQKKPSTCTVTVYRIISGIRCPYTHTAVFKEFEGGSYSMWPKMPFQMIAKVAESFALRKAFGGEFEGIYTDDEIPALRGETTADQTVLVEPTEIQFEQLLKRVEHDGPETVLEKAMKYFILTDQQIEKINGTTTAD